MEVPSDPFPNPDAGETPEAKPMPESVAIPVLPLDYFPNLPSGPIDWVTVAECQSVREWHLINQVLRSANIHGVLAGDDEVVELKVSREYSPRAQKIIEAFRAGKSRIRKPMPNCGSPLPPRETRRQP